MTPLLWSGTLNVSRRYPHSIAFSWYFQILSTAILNYLRIHFYLMFFKSLWDLSVLSTLEKVKTCQLKELHSLWAVTQQIFNWLWEILCLISVQKTSSNCFLCSFTSNPPWMLFISFQGSSGADSWVWTCTMGLLVMYDKCLIFTSSQGLIHDPVWSLCH